MTPELALSVRPMLAHAGTPDELVGTLLLFGAAWTGWIVRSRIRGVGFARMPKGVAFGLIPVALVFVGLAFIVPPWMRRQALKPPQLVSTVRPASTAHLSFVKPAPGQVVHGRSLEAVMKLTGGRIVSTSSTTLSPDEGHIHVSIDGRLISMTYGTLQSIDVGSLPAGPHELQAEFVASDHGPFDPRVIASVRFVVAR